MSLHMNSGDPEINACLIAIQEVLEGAPMEAALNALAILVGTYSALGGDDEEGMTFCLTTAATQSKLAATQAWANPGVHHLRRVMRGDDVQ